VDRFVVYAEVLPKRPSVNGQQTNGFFTAAYFISSLTIFPLMMTPMTCEVYSKGSPTKERGQRPCLFRSNPPDCYAEDACGVNGDRRESLFKSQAVSRSHSRFEKYDPGLGT